MTVTHYAGPPRECLFEMLKSFFRKECTRDFFRRLPNHDCECTTKNGFCFRAKQSSFRLFEFPRPIAFPFIHSSVRVWWVDRLSGVAVDGDISPLHARRRFFLRVVLNATFFF